jgi:hypothetical protein
MMACTFRSLPGNAFFPDLERHAGSVAENQFLGQTSFWPKAGHAGAYSSQ